jgi:hypothetical protein
MLEFIRTSIYFLIGWTAGYFIYYATTHNKNKKKVETRFLRDF